MEVRAALVTALVRLGQYTKERVKLLLQLLADDAAIVRGVVEDSPLGLER